jgi:hypothetical protein
MTCIDDIPHIEMIFRKSTLFREHAAAKLQANDNPGPD